MIGQVNNMTLSFFLLTLALSTPVSKTHGSLEKVNPNLYAGVSPLAFLNGHLGKIGVLKHSPEYFELLSKTVEDLRGIIEDSGSEINDVRGEIDDLVDEIVQDLPDEIEDLDDMINGTVDRTKIEDSGSEIKDVRDEIDNLVDDIVKDLPDEIEDFDEMINGTVESTKIEDSGSEINDARGEIDNLGDELVKDLPDEIENFDDMINETIYITKIEDSASEINDVRDEIDNLVDEIVKDLPDEIEDFDDMINETIDITNESDDEVSSRKRDPNDRFLKDPWGSEDLEDDEELEAKSRTKRFALFDPLRYLRREVRKNRVRPNIPYIFMSRGRPGFDSRGAVRVETGADPKAIQYGRTGVGYPRRPRFKK